MDKSKSGSPEGEPLLHILGKYLKEKSPYLLFVFASAAAAAFAIAFRAVAGAFRAIGASDALNPFLFGSVNIQQRRANNSSNDCNNKNINGFHFTYHSERIPQRSAYSF